MAILKVVSPIEATHRGPEVDHGDGRRLVHLQQGSLDGACGPYCVFMALIASNALDPSDLDYGRVDGRTQLGKLQKAMATGGGLFGVGTDVDELAQAIQSSHGTKVNVESSDAVGVQLRAFVTEHLDEDHVVIVGVEGADLAHWVLAVGLEFESDVTEEAKRLLTLDPGLPAPIVSAWNRTIELTTNRGRYPFKFWPGLPHQEDGQKCQLAHAVAIWPKG